MDHDDWLNDSRAYEDFANGQLPKNDDAKIERELDEIKENGMRLSAVIESLSVESGIPESVLWRASAKLYPELTRNRARISDRLGADYRMAVERQAREEVIPNL
jgi:hypothetical protein